MYQYNNNFYILLIIITLITSCKKSDFEYVKFNEFKFQKTDIEDGTKIKILSFSGGRDCTFEETYYYQFIGINQTSGDTVRILTPCQQFDINDFKIGIFSPDNENINNTIAEIMGDKDHKNNEKFIVFNKKLEFIEKRNYKTTIGFLSFKE